MFSKAFLLLYNLRFFRFLRTRFRRQQRFGKKDVTYKQPGVWQQAAATTAVCGSRRDLRPPAATPSRLHSSCEELLNEAQAGEMLLVAQDSSHFIFI